MMPVNHRTLCFCQRSHITSCSSSHSFAVRDCIFSHATGASSSLAMLLIVCCTCITSPTCCLTVLSILLLQSAGVLTVSEASLVSLFPLLLCFHSLLAAMKDTCVVFPDIVPAVLFASPASTMCISLSLVGFPTIPQIGLLPSCVTIITGGLVVMSLRLDSHAASCDYRDFLEVPERTLCAPGTVAEPMRESQTYSERCSGSDRYSFGGVLAFSDYLQMSTSNQFP